MRSDLLKCSQEAARRGWHRPGPDDTPGGVAIMERTCSLQGCTQPHEARGFCHAHYEYRRRHGLLPPLPNPTVEERFWAKVNRDGPIPDYRSDLGPCWLWTAGGRIGYGSFGAYDAHRWAWLYFRGPVAEELTLDHLCRVRRCVKVFADEQGPAHLEPVTRGENIRRGLLLRPPPPPKTHCPHGHTYDQANTGYTKEGHRYCLTCQRLYAAARRAAKRAGGA